MKYPGERSRIAFRAGCVRALRLSAVAGLAFSALLGCGTREPESPGTEALVSLMTAEQYRNSLSYIFGPGIDLNVEFAPVARSEGLLANSAAVAGVSSAQLQGIQGVASSVARQVVDATHRNYLVPCEPQALNEADDACARQFLSRVGRLLFRRALSERSGQRR